MIVAEACWRRKNRTLLWEDEREHKTVRVRIAESEWTHQRNTVDDGNAIDRCSDRIVALMEEIGAQLTVERGRP